MFGPHETGLACNHQPYHPDLTAQVVSMCPIQDVLFYMVAMRGSALLCFTLDRYDTLCF